MTDIQKQVSADMKTAMKNREGDKLTALRGILAKFKEAEIARPDGRRPLTDDEAMGVLRKMVKPVQESLDMFIKGGREDAAEKARLELSVIEGYLPQAPKPEAVREAVIGMVAGIEAPSMKDMGPLMARLKAHFGPALDASVAGPIVKDALTVKAASKA